MRLNGYEALAFDRASKYSHLVHSSLDIETYPALVPGPDLIYCLELAPWCRLRKTPCVSLAATCSVPWSNARCL